MTGAEIAEMVVTCTLIVCIAAVVIVWIWRYLD